MSEDRARILEMLKQGKITVQEAEQLLDAVKAPAESTSVLEKTTAGRPRYLRVLIKDGSQNATVNVRVPLSLLRAGIKLTSLIPKEAQEKVQKSLNDKGMSFDLSSIKPENLEELIDGLSEMKVEIDDKNEDATVRVFCE